MTPAAPSAANARTQAEPIPPAPPVTSTRFPPRPVSTGLTLSPGGCLHDPEPLDEREERPREGRRLGPRAHVLPVDLLPQRPRVAQELPEVRLLLGDREELRRHHVLEREDVDAKRRHLDHGR